MDIPFVNLAVPFQDIFYNCAIVNELINADLRRGGEIQFVVFDLYDYFMFNLDTSRLIVALWYIQKGGLLKEHNYSYNKNGNGSFADDCRDRLGIIIEKDEKRINEIIKKNYGEFQFSNERWHHIEMNACLKKEVLLSSAIYNKYNATIKENRDILNTFLKEYKKIYPNIKVIFTLIPRYKSVEEVHNEML